MANPGWYPDPAGAKGVFRYWDGSKWTSQTSAYPGTTPPGGGKQGSGSRRLGLPIIGGVLVVLAAILLWFLLSSSKSPFYPFQPVPEDTNSSTPTITGWDETSSPTPPPTQQASLQTCPYTQVDGVSKQRMGVITGGGLQFDKIPGWRNDSMYLQWVSDLHVQVDTVRPGWISNVGVGQLNREDGFVDLSTSALQTMQCFASSGYYTQFVERVDLVNEATTIDGHAAWRMTSEVRIANPQMPEIAGDVVDVVVVDVADPDRLGVYISSVTIGDDARQQQVDQAYSTLRLA